LREKKPKKKKLTVDRECPFREEVGLSRSQFEGEKKNGSNRTERAIPEAIEFKKEKGIWTGGNR